MMNKHQVAKRFSQKAKQYTEHAKVQKVAQQTLFSMLEPHLGTLSGRALDIGTGPGEALLKLNELGFDPLGLDISPGMLKEARQYGDVLLADMDTLPLQSASASLIYSNFAMQWSQNLSVLFGRCYHALEENGLLAVTVLVEGTLPELKRAQLAANLNEQCHPYVSEQHAKSAAKLAGFQLLDAKLLTLCDTFISARAAIASINAIGASGCAKPAPLAKSAYHALLNAYPEARESTDNQALYCTHYQVLYMVLKK